VMDLPWEETMDVNEGSRGYSDGYEAAEKAAEAILAATKVAEAKLTATKAAEGSGGVNM
jgi:hypothetical protein